VKAVRILCCAALLALEHASWACGVCVEDKVAATYDYAVMQQASTEGHVMVFCEVNGRLDSRRIRNAARQVRGLDRSSLRLSPQPAALSFALDAARQSPQAAVSAMEQALPAGTHLAIIKVVAPSRGAATAQAR
jgi:hypothetical protein